MRKINNTIVILLLLLGIMPGSLYSQSLKLPDKWLLKIGDDSTFKNPGFNDRNWQKVIAPTTWEANGHKNYDGYGWFRLHFKADPSKLPEEIYLMLGKIDDIDETYLNGVLIGATGQVKPVIESGWNAQRAYKIPAGLLKKDNVIAVRVYDYLYDGGLQPGYYGIYDRDGYVRIMHPGPGPKKSFFQITTANGLIAAVYNQEKNLIETVTPHMFKMYDEKNDVEPFIKNLKLKSKEEPVSAGYINNTHVINIDYKNFSLKLFAPFAYNQKVFYAVLEGNEKTIGKLDFTFDKGKAKVLTEKAVRKLQDGNIRRYFLFSFSDSVNNNTKIIKTAANMITLVDPVTNEVNYMRNVIQKAYIPEGLSQDEKNLYEQSISILKMGQISDREVFPKSRGQILASLPPGGWNIGWLRDGMYSIMAFSRLGFYTEAKAALNFFLNADAGYYVNFKWKDGVDYGVKTDYRLSVCRYFGMGKEESDFNENGPNIELDGFGLFLTGFTDYIKKSNDVQYLKDNYDVISRLIADPIISFITDNNLIRMESGPWEYHLPGRQYAFTAIVNSAGLRNFAELCKANNLPGYEKYIEASERLQKGIMQNLVFEGKLIKGYEKAASPDTIDFYDGGTVEAFNQDVIKDDEFFKTYYKEYTKGLKINERRGFSRLNNPDWYTIGEWPFLNLRYSSALLKYGLREEAKKLIDWTTDYSKMNFNYVAEVYEYKTENYEGAVPMVGYGAGAYILTLCDYYNK
jgi:GH15 family glucan-1,4-alpha-glucosidase